MRNTYILEGNRCSERVHEPCTSGRQLEDTHALCAHVVGQDLARVDGLHRCKRERKDRAEDVDERNRSDGSCLAASVDKVGCGPCCDR